MENRGWFGEIRGWPAGYDGSRLVEYGNRSIKRNRGCDNRISRVISFCCFVCRVIRIHFGFSSRFEVSTFEVKSFVNLDRAEKSLTEKRHGIIYNFAKFRSIR